MKYEKPEMLILTFVAEDVITTSQLVNKGEDPDEGFDF